jgi:polyhydroxybutyrate depolymerase
MGAAGSQPDTMDTQTPGDMGGSSSMPGAGGTVQDGMGGSGGSMEAAENAGMPGESTGGMGGSGVMGMDDSGGAGGDSAMGGMSGMEEEPPAGADPVPSSGCGNGNANPQLGSENSPLSASQHNYYVKLPAGYDGNTPQKVMIVFPPTGNPIGWSERSAGYEQAAPEAIRVYTHMSNESSGWQPNETNFFQGLYDAIVSNFCVDTTRIFAGGESSGGEFAGFVGCEYGDIVRGVVPTAPKMTSWQINLGAHDCKGNPTAIVMWSEQDSVLQQPAGPAFRDFYRDMNMCDQTTTPVEGWSDEPSNCVAFDGCLEGSQTYFCSHNDPEYNGTHHGWPLFAGEMTWEIFSAL